MQHSEFNALIGFSISEEDYRTVERVYAYHPMLEGKDSNAKDLIKQLFVLGGMPLLREMVPAANKMAQLEEVVQQRTVALDQAQQARRQALADYAAGMTIA